ncbi:MAG: hypothetical protein RL136_10 [Planctomycetota bacterium]
MPSMPFHLHHRPTAVRRGLTLIEVLIASVILAVAGLAALELLSQSDANSLFARRQALAAVEAERMLEESAELVRQRQSAQRSARLDDGDAAEALVGCHAEIREARDRVGLGHSGRTEVRVDVVRLTAEILDPRGNSLVRLERMVPTAIAEEAP